MVLAAAAVACGSNNNDDCVAEQTSSGDVAITSGHLGPDGGAPQCPSACAVVNYASVTSCAVGGDADGGFVAHCTWSTPAHCGKLAANARAVTPRG
jgi:hypothetical protein